MHFLVLAAPLPQSRVVPGITDSEEGRHLGCGPKKLLPLTATRSKLALQPHLSLELSNTGFNLVLFNTHLFQTT